MFANIRIICIYPFAFCTLFRTFNIHGKVVAEISRLLTTVTKSIYGNYKWLNGTLIPPSRERTNYACFLIVYAQGISQSFSGQ